MAGSVPLGKNPGYFFPGKTQTFFLLLLLYLDPVLTESKGSFHYVSSAFANLSHLTLFQISEKFFLGLNS